MVELLGFVNQAPEFLFSDVYLRRLLKLLPSNVSASSNARFREGVKLGKGGLRAFDKALTFQVNFRIAEDLLRTRPPGEYVFSQHKKYMSLSISPSFVRL
jgi:hypothetical protein